MKHVKNYKQFDNINESSLFWVYAGLNDKIKNYIKSLYPDCIVKNEEKFTDDVHKLIIENMIHKDYSNDK